MKDCYESQSYKPFGCAKDTAKIGFVIVGLIRLNKKILTIPLHEELDKGTLRAIFRQALRYIPEEESRPHFYG